MQMPREIGTFHIIGIGGIGMSAIAEILLAKGYSVQGSDQKDSANVRRLRAKGVRVFIGHDPVNLVGARSVVISSAVKSGNPELEAARAKGLPVIRRAEILAELMRLYSTVSVTGTHGKTTTTSLIAHVFTESKYDPTVISGGIINQWGSNARLGKGEWMIVEADESDGTFVRLPTQIGIVTNIDPEHLDYFGSVENMHREFETFFRNIPFYGLAVTCIDHPVARDMIERLALRRDGRRLLTYGTTRGADLQLRGLRHERGAIVIDAELGARVRGGARAIRGWSVPILGQHNALNTLAAIAACSEAGLSDEAIRAALASVQRRQAPLRAHRHLERRGDLRRLRRITRRRSRQCSRPRGPECAGGSSPCLSRTAIRACTISSASSAPASATPIASSWRRSTRRARRLSTASTITTSRRAIRTAGHPAVNVHREPARPRSAPTAYAAAGRHCGVPWRRHVDRLGTCASRLAGQRP